MKNSLKGWSHSQRSGIWWSRSFEKIGKIGEITGCHLGNFVSLRISTTQPYKKSEIFPLAATWMEPEGIMLSEIRQTEEDKYCLISLICGI